VKFLDEYRDPEIARRIFSEIAKATTRDWVIMEVCGGQTHSIVRNGIDQLLPDKIELVHGPGCPVCVTPLEMIEKAIALARREEVILTSFGDMLRVPGKHHDLLSVKSEGGDVRMVYSPLEALDLARKNPAKRVVFFAVGFETTTPHTAMAVWQAHREGLGNFHLLVSHVLVPPAIESLVSSPHNRVNGYLLAGHVCAVTGWRQYEPICERHNLPMAVTGFEPVDLLDGILSVVRQLESGKATVDNCYPRIVTRDGNPAAQRLVDKIYGVCDRKWRGIGNIPSSGLILRDEFKQFDAECIFDLAGTEVDEPPECISGLVLQGLKKPFECPEFGRKCTPATPLGATMVSSEGACAAYYAYHRFSNQLPTSSATEDKQ
jgi:hydrogenase expression/formation protein HypD